MCPTGWLLVMEVWNFKGPWKLWYLKYIPILRSSQTLKATLQFQAQALYKIVFICPSRYWWFFSSDIFLIFFGKGLSCLDQSLVIPIMWADMNQIQPLERCIFTRIEDILLSAATTVPASGTNTKVAELLRVWNWGPSGFEFCIEYF